MVGLSCGTHISADMTVSGALWHRLFTVNDDHMAYLLGPKDNVLFV